MNRRTPRRPGRRSRRGIAGCAAGLAAAALVVAPVPTALASGIEVDHALTFDGVDDRATAGTEVIPTTSGAAFTVEAWVFDADANAGFQHIVSQGNGGTVVYLGTRSGSQELRAGDRWLATGVLLPAQRWVHVALTVAAGTDGAQVAKLYLDGRLEAETAAFGAPTGIGSDFQLGTQYTTAEFWNGRIDTVRVWDVERSQAEIVGSMHAALTAGTSGLIAQYLANEGAGTTVNDTVSPGTAHDLTLVGGAGWATVATTSTVGTDSVVTFPRSAITAAGGWTFPDGYARADLLVVAGGGGGGAWVGGGGGAGGVVEMSAVAVTPGQTVPITVGVGGRGATKTAAGAGGFTAGTNGQDSSVGFTAIATGGGVGASWDDQSAGSGGSGGGGSRSASPGAAGIGTQGSRGGDAGSDVQPHPSGGGGGADGVGASGSGSASGAGGPGRPSSITGASVTYAGGGGGGSHGTWANSSTFTSAGINGVGGPGGGGAGAGATAAGQVVRAADGTPGLGGGGGGAGNNCGTTCQASFGGRGGSGVVIVRLQLAVATQLEIATQPVGGGATGAVLTTQPVVRIVDTDGRLIVGDGTTTVTAAVLSGGGTLGGTTTVTAVGGVATFTDLTLTAAEGVDQVLRFTSTPALTAVDASAIRIASAAPRPPASTGTPPSSGPVPSAVPAGDGGPAARPMDAAVLVLSILGVGLLLAVRRRPVTAPRR